MRSATLPQSMCPAVRVRLRPPPARHRRQTRPSRLLPKQMNVPASPRQVEAGAGYTSSAQSTRQAWPASLRPPRRIRSDRLAAPREVRHADPVGNIEDVARIAGKDGAGPHVPGQDARPSFVADAEGQRNASVRGREAAMWGVGKLNVRRIRALVAAWLRAQCGWPRPALGLASAAAFTLPPQEVDGPRLCDEQLSVSASSAPAAVRQPARLHMQPRPL